MSSLGKVETHRQNEQTLNNMPLIIPLWTCKNALSLWSRGLQLRAKKGLVLVITSWHMGRKTNSHNNTEELLDLA